MEQLRVISARDYAKIATPSSLGRPSKLDWIAINKLVVDPAYQRDIVGKGRTNVRRIAAAFNWSMFAPVVVAPAGSNTFAIVDGQHRVTAALICGVDKVPCAIIDCTKAEQAAAFSAINGLVTRMNSLQVHHAAVASGDAKAILVEKTVSRADVVILRYPKPWDDIRVGETMALRAIERAIQKFGEDVVVTALKTIRETADGNAGLLRAQIIFGTAEVLADHPEWRESGAALLEAFDNIDLAEMLDSSSAAAARGKGSTITDQFESRLVAALTEHFQKRKRA